MDRGLSPSLASTRPRSGAHGRAADIKLPPFLRDPPDHSQIPAPKNRLPQKQDTATQQHGNTTRRAWWLHSCGARADTEALPCLDACTFSTSIGYAYRELVNSCSSLPLRGWARTHERCRENARIGSPVVVSFLLFWLSRTIKVRWSRSAMKSWPPIRTSKVLAFSHGIDMDSKHIATWIIEPTGLQSRRLLPCRPILKASSQRQDPDRLRPFSPHRPMKPTAKSSSGRGIAAWISTRIPVLTWFSLRAPLPRNHGTVVTRYLNWT
ncbi:hypothetical protein B0J13DRAFT_6211 [Dactylonectria estremocensis]|uniref:Uncharacterized protein n=1 Tax=Dactylonectria estremocensis TaxID=1079267 RepID=A0A9P9FJQ7_9HYPO|nr:hypothetical protein B0J13DRAFT_6211 [Dactylonectria estremocensis]